MGAGIAVDMKKHYKLGSLIADGFPDCIYYHGVLNLITKKKYFGKPTYETMQNALNKLHDIIIMNDIHKIAMPIIGCGLDRLDWNIVSQMIQNTFIDIQNLEILVCKLGE